MILFYFRYLHRLCVEKGIDKEYGFIEPNIIANGKYSDKEVQGYIQSRLHSNTHKYYLAPYLSG